MTRVWKTKKTILKHFFVDEDRSYLTRIIACNDAEILAKLEEFAEAVWHEAYIDVDYNSVTPDMVRNNAAKCLLALDDDE